MVSAAATIADPAQMYPRLAAGAVSETEVPFQPTNGKPVYCSDCFRSVRGN